MLQKQLVHLNLTGGLQKKDDDSLVIPTKLTTADDVEFDDASTVIRRGGQETVTLPAGYTTAVRCFAHKNAPIIEFNDGSTIRANNSMIASDFANWRGGGLTYEPNRFARVGVETRRVLGLGVTGTYAAFDTAVGVTNYCVAWVESDSSGQNAVQVSIRNRSTDVEIQRNVVSGAATSESVTQPRVIYDSTNARFSIFTYHEDSALVSASLKGSYVSEAGGAFTGPTILITMNFAAGTNIGMTDAAIYQGQGYCLVARDADAAGLIRMRLVNLSHAAIIATVTGAPATLPVSLTAHATYSGGVLTGHALYGAGANLRGRRVPSNTGIITAESTITTIGGRLVGRVAVVDSGGGLIVACDVFVNTTDTYARTYIVSCSTAHVLVNQTYAQTNCFLAGRVFSMRSRFYIPLVFESLWNQGTIFVLDVSELMNNLGSATAATPYFVARLAFGESASSSMASATGTARRVVGSDISLLPYFKFESDLRLAGSSNQTAVCVEVAKFDPTGQLGDVEVNGLSFLAGACPLICDGRQLVEEGFHWGPEVATVALTPVATGTGVFTFPNTTGTYSVAFTEGWMDAQGNWHESAVAKVHTVSITAGSGNLDINPAFIRPPSMKASRILIMYRTLITSTDTSLYLAHTGDLSGTAAVEVAEANLASGEQIYTSGGVLSNTPAPPCRHASLFQKRIVLSGCGDGSRVYWSKQTIPGYGPEFAIGDPTHSLAIPQKAGRAVASEELDDRLVIFGENLIGMIAGSGPDPTGTSGQYSEWSTIVPDTGCAWDSPKSVARFAEGVWFRASSGGFRAVSRSGGLARSQDGKYAGAEVDPLVSGSTISVRANSRSQTRFFQSTGTCLVFDHQWGQWTRFTGMANVSATAALVGNTQRFLHLSNYATTTPLLRYTEDAAPQDIADNGTAGNTFSAYVETAWISMAGIQGFQRIYRVMLLGKNATGAGSDMDMGLYLFRDFDGSTVSEQFDTIALGAPITTQAGTGKVQVQHHVINQKCESVRLGVYFQPAAGNDGRFRLTDLTLQIGVKRGYFKLPSSVRY